VQSGKLPEWSPVYICPNWFKVQIPAEAYENGITNIPLTANVSRCPYYIEIVSPNQVRVRCRYHTNDLNYIIDLPK